MPADLRVHKVDPETAETLAERGFFVLAHSGDPDSAQEVLSNAGDITLQMADGAATFSASA